MECIFSSAISFVSIDLVRTIQENGKKKKSNQSEPATMPEPELEEEKKDDGRHKVFFDISHGTKFFFIFHMLLCAH